MGTFLKWFNIISSHLLKMNITYTIIWTMFLRNLLRIDISWYGRYQWETRIIEQLFYSNIGTVWVLINSPMIDWIHCLLLVSIIHFLVPLLQFGCLNSFSGIHTEHIARRQVYESIVGNELTILAIIHLYWLLECFGICISCVDCSDIVINSQELEAKIESGSQC